MLAVGKREVIVDAWTKQLRTGKTKPTAIRSYRSLFNSSKVGKAGLIHSSPSQGPDRK